MRITSYHNWCNKHGEKNHLCDLAQNRLYHNKNAMTLYTWLLIDSEDEKTIDIPFKKIQEQTSLSRTELSQAFIKLLEQNCLSFLGEYSAENSDPCDNLNFHFHEYPLKQVKKQKENEFTITLKATYIPGYEGLYGLTEDGQVWSEYSNRFLKPQSEGKKTFVKLWKDKKSKDFTIKELKEKVQKAEK